jgi:DNA-3-methyladenine glycosylase II
MTQATAKKPDYWQTAKKHLSKNDPVLARIIRRYKGEALASRGSAFFSLARAIVGQQISVKAADSVWKKLEAVMARVGEANSRAIQLDSPRAPRRGTRGMTITPESLLMADDATLRACGLSRQKVLYLKELSQFFTRRTRHDWHLKSNEEVVADLISIKGIGKWSAEMFLIFHLLRADIFPVGDLGLRKAIEKHYNNGKTMPLPKMLRLAQGWKPYRTVATWYLWRSLDPVAVEY